MNKEKIYLDELPRMGKTTNKFKIEIGTNFIDEKRNITIIDRKYKIRKVNNNHDRKDKWYKYKCNICGWDEGWIEESNLLNHKQGCSCCCNRTPVLGINTIWDTDKWMCDLGISEKDAKTHTKCSNQKIILTCSDCGQNKSIIINNIYKRKSIQCNCGDGQSYPNKLGFALLTQLKINFKTEYSPDWCKYKFNNKIKKGRYDFYFKINNKKYIVEMDGELGHGNHIHSKNKMTKEESKQIDDIKDRLANEHSIKVIRIDCKKSELEYIKKYIFNSELNKLFNLTKINWLECEKHALSNRVLAVCNIKKDNPDKTATEIGEIMKLDRHTIVKYLKKGTKLGWCNYNPKEELKKEVLKIIN